LQEITRALLTEHPLPEHEGGDKRDRGRLLVIAGSVEMPGAALLAALSALRAGAGILQIATCETHAPHLGIAMPEAMVVGCPVTSRGGIDPAASSRIVELALGCDAVLVGPGMADEEAIIELSVAVLKGVVGPYFVLDAAAFTCLRAHLETLTAKQGRIVVTPHAGEMAKFLEKPREDVERDPLAAAKKTTAVIGGVVVLKGVRTHIASPSGETWLCDHGCIGLATSGSGDTLGGIMAGLLARGAQPEQAAFWSVYIHGEAGQRLTRKSGSLGFLAREIPDEIPRILEDLRSTRSGARCS